MGGVVPSLASVFSLFGEFFFIDILVWDCLGRVMAIITTKYVGQQKIASSLQQTAPFFYHCICYSRCVNSSVKCRDTPHNSLQISTQRVTSPLICLRFHAHLFGSWNDLFEQYFKYIMGSVQGLSIECLHFPLLTFHLSTQKSSFIKPNEPNKIPPTLRPAEKLVCLILQTWSLTPNPGTLNLWHLILST